MIVIIVLLYGLWLISIWFIVLVRMDHNDISLTPIRTVRTTLLSFVKRFRSPYHYGPLIYFKTSPISVFSQKWFSESKYVGKYSSTTNGVSEVNSSNLLPSLCTYTIVYSSRYYFLTCLFLETFISTFLQRYVLNMF